MSMLFLDEISCSFQWCTWFCVKSNMVCRKMHKTVHGNWSCIQHQFSAHRTQLRGKPSAPFERAENSGLATTHRFYIYCIFVQENHDILARRTGGVSYIARTLEIPGGAGHSRSNRIDIRKLVLTNLPIHGLERDLLEDFRVLGPVVPNEAPARCHAAPRRLRTKFRQFNCPHAAPHAQRG